MTPHEQAQMRDLQTRIQLLERRISYLERHKKRAQTERQTAVNNARYLHGLLLSAAIQTGARKAS